MGHVIGMVLCLTLAMFSHLFSEDINEFFVISVEEPQENSAPLVGLQLNESWLVVLVDFESNPLEDSVTNSIRNELEEYAQEYLSEATGKNVMLSVDVYGEILTAPKPVSAYGADGPSGRDYGEGTEFLPAQLAEFVVQTLQTDSLEDYDLNDDGVVDRFLILHSTQAQEQGSGSSDRIWSHFTSFREPISKDDSSFEHYTMTSMRHGQNGLGTMLHEMLHQFGAFDLYPVHDSGYSGAWKGIGVWDIMASGNWNGGGNTPSLPTGPSMAAIGHPPTREIDLVWPIDSLSPCIGPTIDLESRAIGGDRLRIQVSEDEFIWIEKRTQQGFDESLPGSGVLVLMEDWSVGDSVQNALNIDQRRPYLQTIEADGNQDQLKGINDGVASDLFQPGDEFGERGVEIRDHDGILVPWYARIVEVDEQWKIEFHSLKCSPTIDVNLENFGSTVLQGEQITLETSEIGEQVQCWGTLDGSDGRTLQFQNNSNEGSLHFGEFSSLGIVDSTATFSGMLNCNSDEFNVTTTVSTVGTIPDARNMRLVDTIHVNEQSTLRLPYAGFGNGSGTFKIEIEGPLSRIATSDSILEIEDGNGAITLQIEPNGLLQENMYVLGTIHVESFNGEIWEIGVELKATENDGFQFIGNQAFVLTTFFLLFAVWFAASVFSRGSKPKDELEDPVQSDEEFFPGNHL